MDHSSDDVAAISQAGKIKSDMLSKKSYMQNLHSARSYLKFQEAGYQKVFSIYQRMEELSSESLLQPKDAKNPAIKEFEELKKQLVDIKNSKLNGISIFDPVATCGEISPLDTDGSDLDYPVKQSGVRQTIRGYTTDAKAYGGTLSFDVRSGGTGEIYRVFMGNTEIFSTGPSFTGEITSTHTVVNKTNPGTDQYEDDSTNPVLLWDYSKNKTAMENSDTWRTAGSANNGYWDRFTISFGPGIETTYQVEIDAVEPELKPNGQVDTTPQNSLQDFQGKSNGAQEKLFTDGGVIRVGNLGEKSTSTQLTIHVETSSIGNVQGVEFMPAFFDKQLDIDSSGNQIALRAVGFETFEKFSIDSSSDAKKTSDKLLGMGNMMGEIECIGGNWLPKIASAINRIDSEILAAESNTLSNEIALGRIVGSDMALETTNHAKQMLKMDMAAFIMSNTTRINDVLAPLTTDHHRSELMSGDALL
jgi:flagellin-like hook-associated protein FlgL